MSIPTQKSTPDKSRAIVITFLVAFLALAGFGITVAVNGFMQTRRAAEPVAERFLTAMEDRDYAAAHRLLSPAARKATSVTRITDLIALLEKSRGKMTGHGDSVNFFAGIDKGTSFAKTSYQESYENGTGSVTVVLVRNGDEWHVQSFNYQL